MSYLVVAAVIFGVNLLFKLHSRLNAVALVGIGAIAAAPRPVRARPGEPAAEGTPLASRTANLAAAREYLTANRVGHFSAAACSPSPRCHRLSSWRRAGLGRTSPAGRGRVLRGTALQLLDV